MKKIMMIVMCVVFSGNLFTMQRVFEGKGDAELVREVAAIANMKNLTPDLKNFFNQKYKDGVEVKKISEYTMAGVKQYIRSFRFPKNKEEAIETAFYLLISLRRVFDLTPNSLVLEEIRRDLDSEGLFWIHVDLGHAYESIFNFFDGKNSKEVKSKVRELIREANAFVDQLPDTVGKKNMNIAAQKKRGCCSLCIPLVLGIAAVCVCDLLAKKLFFAN